MLFANLTLSIVKISIFACFISLLCSAAIAKEPADWRPDYKAMVQSYYANDYDKATAYGNSSLNKVLEVKDANEKNIALEQIIRQFRSINAKYEQSQNYAQKETVLRSLLKAQEAKNDDQSSFQITNARKNLAICLIIEGKNNEAENYLPKQTKSKSLAEEPDGWKKDLDLLSEASKSDDLDTIYKFAKSATEKAISVSNATEKNVALTQVLQQLQMNEYKFKRIKDYSNEEKMLKLVLQLQQAQETQKSPDTIVGNFQSNATLKNLVTCLVMQGKNEEAVEYDAQYKQANEKSMKQAQQFQKELQDRLLNLNQKNKDQI